MKPGLPTADFQELGEAAPLTDRQRLAEQQAAFLVPFVRDWIAEGSDQQAYLDIRQVFYEEYPSGSYGDAWRAARKQVDAETPQPAPVALAAPQAIPADEQPKAAKVKTQPENTRTLRAAVKRETTRRRRNGDYTDPRIKWPFARVPKLADSSLSLAERGFLATMCDLVNTGPANADLHRDITYAALGQAADDIGHRQAARYVASLKAAGYVTTQDRGAGGIRYWITAPNPVTA